jgi:hypothetical protein
VPSATVHHPSLLLRVDLVYLASTQNGQPDDRSEIRMGRLAQVSKEDRDTACNILMLHTDLHSAFSKRTPEADVHNSKRPFA